ncbi:MAG TPA: VOC family protein [Candidatus Dormibacteraeota bacterium]|nr:VOC family protein [Candidatus Dormibacteraeota bacterium]HEX2681440.1 VOC family protein [Candidatus Dormibacteraeota bacterium]
MEGLAEIVLWAADIEVTLAFYRDNFGLELISPPALPNKFLRVASPGAIPEMIVLVPHPYPDDYFPTHKMKEMRTLHHLAFRVSRQEYEALETRFIEAGVEVRHGVHPVLKDVRTFYVDDPDGNEIEVIGPAA